MGNKSSPPVPAGLKWCRGCATALPVEAFGLRRCRGALVRYSRCAPCLDKQRREAAAAYAVWQAHLAARAALRRPPAVPLRLPEELDLVPLSLR